MAIFNAPALLGGQAAKAGLSCNSCHSNGRDNPYFLLPSLSGDPGTADVSNSFFSAARGNGVFDPVRIPDLALPGKISRLPTDPALHRFTRNLIVEEFAGKEPSPRTLAALTAYMRAIRQCPSGVDNHQDQRLADQLRIIDAAISGAIIMRQRGDDAGTILLIRSARHQLGLLYNRYSSRQFVPIQRSILAASKRLEKITELSDKADFTSTIQLWQRDFDRTLTPRLIRAETRSLYNKDRIEAALGS